MLLIHLKSQTSQYGVIHSKTLRGLAFHLRWKQKTIIRTYLAYQTSAWDKVSEKVDTEQNARDSPMVSPCFESRAVPSVRALALLWVPSADENRHSHLLHCSLPLLPSQESQESLSVTQTWGKVSSDEIFLSPYTAGINLFFCQFPQSPSLCSCSLSPNSLTESGWQNKK